MKFRQGWTTHQCTHEGGRKTHAMRGESSTTLCGLDMTKYVPGVGELRDEPADKLWLYVDCQKCLHILESQVEG